MFQLLVSVPSLDCKSFSDFLSLYKNDLEYKIPVVPRYCSNIVYSIRSSSYTEEDGYEIDEDEYCTPITVLNPSIEDLMAYIIPREWKYEIFYS